MVLALFAAAWACSPDETVYEAGPVGEAVPPGTVLRARGVLLPSALYFTTDEGVHLGADRTGDPPEYWGAWRLPNDLADGVYTLDFGDDLPVEVVVAADAAVVPPDGAGAIDAIAATVDEGRIMGGVCDTGPIATAAVYEVEASLPGFASPGWVAELYESQQGYPVDWAWLEPGPSHATFEYDEAWSEGGLACFTLRVRGPDDVVATESAEVCADAAAWDAPGEEGEEATTEGCGCAASTGASSRLAAALLALVLLRRRR